MTLTVALGLVAPSAHSAWSATGAGPGAGGAAVLQPVPAPEGSTSCLSTGVFEITVRWTANAAPVTGYAVRRTSGGVTTNVAEVGPATLSFTETSAEAGLTPSYAVVSRVAGWSAASAARAVVSIVCA